MSAVKLYSVNKGFRALPSPGIPHSQASLRPSQDLVDEKQMKFQERIQEQTEGVRNLNLIGQQQIFFPSPDKVTHNCSRFPVPETNF